MSSNSIIYGIGGIVIGFAIGFFVMNSINREGISEKQRDSRQAMAVGPDSVKPISPEVEDALEQARSKPQNYDLQIAAGDICMKIGRYDNALDFYQAARKLRPKEFQSIVKVGNGFFENKKYANAQELYKKALEMKPDDVAVRTDFGLTFIMQEPPDVDRAIREFNRALESDPRHAIALQNLAIAFRSKGDTESMNKTLARLEKVEPDNPVIKTFRETQRESK